jgi:hypothetical protein
MPRQQCAGAVLMVRPASFGFNPETAATNHLQRRGDPAADAQAHERACAEFDGLARALESEGIAVCVVEDTAAPAKPDAIFPNNWVSFHADGTVVLYPMQSVTRRAERRPEALPAALNNLGFNVARMVDLTHHENAGRYLEGTGSLVLDHIERVAYAGCSARTDPQVAQEWARELEYEVVLFDTRGASGAALYHTNVMLCIGARAAIVGSECIVPADRARVLERLGRSGREVIELTAREIEQFAGNMLELATWDEALGDSHVLVMSAAARAGLRGETLARVNACTDTLLTVPVPTIERLGGGGVRCMLAEVFVT